jgi:hypothetical protein
VVELLLSKRANVNAKDNEGHTALYWATLGGQKDLADFLRQHGAQQASTTQAGTATKSAESRTFLAGEISIRGDVSVLDTKFFTCTPIQPLKKGDKVAAMVSDDQGWSINTRSLPVGTGNAFYPIFAMVKSSDGFHSLFPAILKAKTNIKVGSTLLSDGYRIESRREVKTGDSISVLFVGDSLLSIETAEGTAKGSDAKPWFAAFRESMKPTERAAAIDAWRLEEKHVVK